MISLSVLQHIANPPSSPTPKKASASIVTTVSSTSPASREVPPPNKSTPAPVEDIFAPDTKFIRDETADNRSSSSRIAFGSRMTQPPMETASSAGIGSILEVSSPKKMVFPYKIVSSLTLRSIPSSFPSYIKSMLLLLRLVLLLVRRDDWRARPIPSCEIKIRSTGMLSRIGSSEKSSANKDNAEPGEIAVPRKSSQNSVRDGA
mmetsp:Transcript_3417/g.6235  ORF Transcript_3417/g.6235 Transcript_3417/m.6235 type:complete len:204 (-) Transcript_3417:446-1057(-)